MNPNYSKAVSASGLELYDRCPSAWARQYLGGSREIEVDYSWFETAKWVKDEKVWLGSDGLKMPSRSKSTSLGKAVHLKNSDYLEGKPVDFHDFPGQVAAPMLAQIADLLDPPPDWMLIEAAGELEGIPGTPDLQLGYDYASRIVLVDWKSCRDFTITARDRQSIQCQKSAETLRTDRQVARYSLPLLREFDLDELECRWVYSRTDPDLSRKAQTTAWMQRREDSERVFAGMKALASELQGWILAFEGHEDPEAFFKSFDQKSESCKMFGGCRHHVDQGGACSPPSNKALIKLGTRKIGTMGIKEQIEANKRAKEAALAKAAAEAAGDPAPPAPEPMAATSLEPAPVATVTPAPAASKPAKAPKAAPAPVADEGFKAFTEVQGPGGFFLRSPCSVEAALALASEAMPK